MHLPLSRCSLLLALAAGPVLSLAGCGGYLMVDGSEAAYVDVPVGIETYPRYAYADGYVYDVNGRYYHQHGGRWVSYRSAPAGMARQREEPRGRAEHQR